MTTILDSPARATAPPAPPWRVVRVLAFREARWILRHPLFLLGIAGTVAMIWITTAWWQAPVLHRDDVRLAGSMLPLAAATMIVCNLAAFRASRHGTEDVEDAAPTPQSRRTAAHLIAFLAPILVAVVLAAGYVAFLYGLGGIWTPRLQELATGPAIVALAAAAGVMLARWIPSPIAGPLGILAFAAWQIRGGGFRGPGYTNWFVPFIDAGNENHVPELTIRPAGWHLMYLLGLAGVLAGVAILRQGARPRRTALLAGPLALIILGGVMQYRPVPADVLAEKLSLATDPSRQVCETRGGVTYCVFPAYRDWIDRWDETVRRVLAPVPATVRPRITIRQVFNDDELYSLRVHEPNAAFPGSIEDEGTFRPGYEAWRPSGDIPMRTAWGRGNDERGASLDLALAVSRKAIGVSEDLVTEKRRYVEEDIERFRKEVSAPGVPDRFGPLPRVGDPYEVNSICSTAGQAREAIGIWVALQAVPGSMDWLRSTLPQHAGLTFEELAKARYGTDDLPEINALTWHGASFVWTTSDIPFSRGGIRTAFDMMRRPSGELARSIAADWKSWMTPTTGLAELHRAFGLPAATGASAQPPMWRLPVC